ncbi:MAG: sensor histidine kinase, partial [Candidatus Binatia bacterium]
MVAELRESGIGVVGAIPWGTHLCHFYETKQDLLDTLVPYFSTGLANDESCLWVVSEPLTQEEAADALRQAVPELDRLMAEQRMEILPHDQWYLDGDALDLERASQGWQAKCDRALAQGHAGLRAAGMAAWLSKNDWRDFADYEYALSAAIVDRRLLVLCTYPLASSGATEVLDVVRAHHVAVSRRRGDWEVVETPDLKQAKQVIAQLNAELEQRVTERTEQLTLANQRLEREVADRRHAEAEVRRLNAELERRVAERTAQLEVANQELQAFSHAVSHDLRAPLRRIQGFCRLLQETYAPVLDEEGRHYLDRIHASTQQLEALVHDLLRLSRVARQDMVWRPVDLSGLVREIAAELQRGDPQRRVELRIAPGLVAQGDAALLRIALENLVANAWKFSATRASARIEFGADQTAEGPAYYVRDDGVGFDMAEAERLFVPFSRLHGAEFEGTGIGLTTVQRIIRRHGGRVWVEAAIDRGATFY